MQMSVPANFELLLRRLDTPAAPCDNQLMDGARISVSMKHTAVYQLMWDSLNIFVNAGTDYSDEQIKTYGKRILDAMVAEVR